MRAIASCIALFTLLVNSACAAERWDPRAANVVVRDPTLLQPALQAARWWSEATGSDVRLSFEDHCIVSHWCTIISRSSLREGLGGHCTNVFASSRIDISEKLTVNREIVQMIAHELGHSIGLEHALEQGSYDVMRPEPGKTAFACTGTESAARYHELYGPAAKFVTICGPDVLPQFAQILPQP